VDHDGDLTGVAAALDGHPTGYLDEDAQAKLAHLDDLTIRLATAGIDAAALLADDELDKTVLTKAHRKVVTQALSGRDLAGPMRHPPRRKLRERALCGSWPAFPADPAEPYELLAALVEDRSDIWARQTFDLVRDVPRLVAALVEDAGDDDVAAAVFDAAVQPVPISDGDPGVVRPPRSRSRAAGRPRRRAGAAAGGGVGGTVRSARPGTGCSSR
jgi:hypothetical protein